MRGVAAAGYITAPARLSTHCNPQGRATGMAGVWTGGQPLPPAARARLERGASISLLAGLAVGETVNVSFH